MRSLDLQSTIGKMDSDAGSVIVPISRLDRKARRMKKGSDRVSNSLIMGKPRHWGGLLVPAVFSLQEAPYANYEDRGLSVYAPNSQGSDPWRARLSWLCGTLNAQRYPFHNLQDCLAPKVSCFYLTLHLIKVFNQVCGTASPAFNLNNIQQDMPLPKGQANCVGSHQVYLFRLQVAIRGLAIAAPTSCHSSKRATSGG